MSTTAILATLESQKSKIGAAVPSTFRASLTFESIRQAVGLACEVSPSLAKCDPRTVYVAVLEATRLGLDVSGNTGEAYLVPFYAKKRSRYECTLIVGQQGKIALAYRSGMVVRILTGVIHENDAYDFDLANGYLSHRIDLKNPNRGEPLAAWARVWTKGAADPIQEIMTAAEFDKIVQASKAKNRGKLSPAYRDWFDEMFRRSVLNRALKRSPKSRDLSELLNAEAVVESRQARADVIDATYTDPGEPETVYLTPDPAEEAEEAAALPEHVEEPPEEKPKAKVSTKTVTKRAKKPPVDADGQASLGGMP